jgi:dTDP-4-dehydrorhamnose 3,5-epimerase
MPSKGHSYALEFDTGIFWNDPDLSIPWPVSPDTAILSEKDKMLASFKEAFLGFGGQRDDYIGS